MSADRQQLLERIRAAADPEPAGEWPAERLAAIRDAGLLSWGLPAEYGGTPCDTATLFHLFRDLSRTCLTTAFILTQREAACHRIAHLAPAELRQKWLPGLASGAVLATVGISHLSTSRQHWRQPTVRIRTTGSGYVLTGEVPWVTGGAYADVLVTGGVLDTGEQLLVALPTHHPGVRVLPPLPLTALRGSWTGSIALDNVELDSSARVCGPAPSVMALSSGGTGSLMTSVVAVGATLGTIDLIRAEAAGRAEILDAANRLQEAADDLWQRILTGTRPAANEPSTDGAPDRTLAERVRVHANSLVTRAALALVTIAKGSGFLAGSPADRAVRESLFFQVWSCPATVSQQQLLMLTQAPATN